MSDSQMETGDVKVEKDDTQLQETTNNVDEEKKDMVETLVDGFKWLLDFYNKKGVVNKDF